MTALLGACVDPGDELLDPDLVGPDLVGPDIVTTVDNRAPDNQIAATTWYFRGTPNAWGTTALSAIAGTS